MRKSYQNIRIHYLLNILMHFNCIKYPFLYLQSIAHTYSKIIAHSTNIYPTTSISRKLFSIVFNAYKSPRNVKPKWFGSVCDITWSFLTLYLLLVKSLLAQIDVCPSIYRQQVFFKLSTRPNYYTFLMLYLRNYENIAFYFIIY